MYTVGQTFQRVVTVEGTHDLGFSGISGDHNPLHTNPDFARRTIFKAPIVHGMLVAGYISALLGMQVADDDHYVVYEGQRLSFKAPVRVGERLLVEAKVSGWNPDNGRLHLSITVTRVNMLDSGKPPKVVVDGTASVRVFELAADEKAA